MERLTHRDNDGTVWITLSENGEEILEAKGIGANKLAEYEVIGLEPKNITKLQKLFELRENCFRQMKIKYENLLKMWESLCGGYAGLWEELQEYQNSDEPKFVLITSQKEALKKQTPERPSHDCGGCYCPECNEWIDEIQVGIVKYCSECGQAFDWEGEKTDV